ncbi:MAG: ribosome biogenesis GTPase Der [Gammaproteobacteria bacterium]|nr:ribosome biogenesis GTPase Der [Gammaproteobacteria bacterium]
MNPVIALVGRPNVGKSTLFNRLTRTRNALVADQPGLTRDRNYGLASVAGRQCVIVDTGGLGEAKDSIDELMERQALQAVDEADQILFLVDGSVGLTPADEEVAQMLRRRGKPVSIVANKSEGREPGIVCADFQSLGYPDVYCISAAHGQGVNALMSEIAERLPEADAEEAAAESSARIAVVGRPNVGKSTLINRLLGEERVIAFDQPGTTRDSVFIPFEREGQSYTLIDTAGVRRRSRVDDMIEKFSIVKTMQAISQCQVAIMVLDAQQEIAEQDARLLGLIVQSGRALVLAINKWDGMDPDARERIRVELDRKLQFVDFAERFFISALHGSGVGELFRAVDRAIKVADASWQTSRLTQLLEEALHKNPPPLVRGRRIKLRYAHQGGRNPPTIIIHGNQTANVPANYERYLENFYRRALKIVGTPVSIQFKTGENPYKGRKNTLTPRQIKHRQRIRRLKK